ncbi:hypothetical protein X975_15518, partial [Stegodyphus mimosarum]
MAEVIPTSSRWTCNETEALLRIWGSEVIQGRLDGTVRDTEVYKDIRKSLSKIGFSRNTVQIKTKIKALRREYRIQRKKLQVIGANAKINFRFFDQMHKILSSKAAGNTDSETEVETVRLEVSASDSIIAETERESSRAETTKESSRAEIIQSSVVLDTPQALKAKFTSCRRRIKENINNISHINLQGKQEEEQEDDYIARLKSNVNELRRIISNSNALQLRINELSSQASRRTDSTNAREKRDIQDVETSMKRVESLIGDITADIKRIEESKLRMKDLCNECGKYVTVLDDCWKKEGRLLEKIKASEKNKDDQKSNPSTSNSSKSNDDSLSRSEVSRNEPDAESTRKRKRDSLQDDSDTEDIDVKPNIRLLNKSIAENIKISDQALQQVTKTEEPQEEETTKNMNYYITDTDKLATELQKNFNIMDDVLISCRSFMNSLVKNVDLMRNLSREDTERSSFESNAPTNTTNEERIKGRLLL